LFASSDVVSLNFCFRAIVLALKKQKDRSFVEKISGDYTLQHYLATVQKHPRSESGMVSTGFNFSLSKSKNANVFERSTEFDNAPTDRAQGLGTLAPIKAPIKSIGAVENRVGVSKGRNKIAADPSSSENTDATIKYVVFYQN
jgi:hypothetical protein